MSVKHLYLSLSLDQSINQYGIQQQEHQFLADSQDMIDIKY